MTVTVKDLLGVVQAVRLGKAAALTECYPQLFDPPAPDAPIIERIDVARPKDTNGTEARNGEQ